MSGIFGVWRLDGRPLEPGALEPMSRALAHRGPDGAATWSEGPVGLGHRTFRTTPESLRERYPVASPDRSVVLTADARIDNRDALIPALGFHEKPPEEVTDAELLLAAYQHWGNRCAERLIGDFAFAVWDAGRREILCFRDHFGVKPLFTFYAPNRLFAFASEIRALLALPEVPDEINELEVARHLLLVARHEHISSTFYRHVRRLAGAHAARVSDRGFEDWRYWRLDPTRRLELSSDDEYAEALRDVFLEAVRCRLRKVAPVASMLSGGLDSSSITCAAAQLLDGSPDGPLHTLSAGYPRVPEADGRSSVDEVLERHHVIPHFFEADCVSPIAEIDRMNTLFGAPSWGANLYLIWELYRLAADAGARVVLDGYGGDATVSLGRGYLWELAMAGRWLKLARVAVPYARRQRRSPVGPYLALVRYGLSRRLRGSIVEGLARRAPARTPSRNRTPATDAVLSEDFVGRFSDHSESTLEPADTERESHFRILNGRPLREGLEFYEACGAGRSVEVRFPFFDVRLAELCLSFPPDQKFRRGWSRYVMRRAMEGILPREIQWNAAKADLNRGWIYAYRANESGGIEGALRNPTTRRYVDPDRLRTLHEKFMAGETNRAEQIAVWRGLSLALWLNASDGRGRPLPADRSFRPE